MRTIEETIKKGTKGLHYGNRILLPFVIDILKLIIDDEIIMNFHPPKSQAEYIPHYDYTEIYFTHLNDVTDLVSEYESVKIVAVEKGKDMFDFNNHVKLALHFKGEHSVEIELLTDEDLFVE